MTEEKSNQYTIKGFLVWGICALFFLYEFLLRTIIGTFQRPIMSDLKLTSFKFSILSTSTYLLIYGLMQIPVGLIVDRVGLKKALFFGAVICCFATAGFAYTEHFYSALFFRMLMGFGSAFGFICLLIAVYEWMPKRNIAFLIGLSQFIGTLGPMLAAGPINAIAENSTMTWRTLFLNLGLIGLLLALAILFIVKNSPKIQGSYQILRRPEQVKSNMIQLFSQWQPWFIALFSASVYFSIEFLSENDGKIFLHLKGFSSYFASYMLTLSWLGYAIGCPLLGFLSDHFERRKSMMQASAILACIVMITIVFSQEKYALLSAFFLLGIAAGGQSIGFATIAEQFKTEYLAVGLALNNAVIMVISSINAPIIGYVIDRVKTTEHASLNDYQTVFYSLIFIAFISLALVSFFIKETFCKSAVDYTYIKNTFTRAINEK